MCSDAELLGARRAHESPGHRVDRSAGQSSEYLPSNAPSAVLSFLQFAASNVDLVVTIFQAGVILVSHDERLIRMVCTELWVCGECSVRCIEGGFDEYRKIVEKELEM